MPKMTLDLDDEDFRTINAEIARRQLSRFSDGGTIVPDGESCLAGALIAEMVRDLAEYRSIWKAANPENR